MDTARKNWNILRHLESDFAKRIRSFMVIGRDDGVLMITEPDGEGFWFGKMCFKKESRQVTKPTSLNVLNLVEMAQGSSHLVLLDNRGVIYTMGTNYWGQLGLDRCDDQVYFKPQKISSPRRKFVSVRCGCDHSLALTNGGKVWAWGENTFGQVGDSKLGPKLSSLYQILELNSVQIVAIECGGEHSVALSQTGVIYTWGCNLYGQLGHSRDQIFAGPCQIQNSTIGLVTKSIAASKHHTLVLTNTEQVYVCGGYHQEINGRPWTNPSVETISKVDALKDISQIASHFNADFSIALSSSDGKCFIWGRLEAKISAYNISTPLKLSAIYSTIDSVFSITMGNTPYSVSALLDK